MMYGECDAVIADYEKQLDNANAEISRLRALAVRVRKIEWVDGKGGSVGMIDGKVRARVYTGINSDMWFYEFYGERGTYFPTIEAAKAACQSAFDAWIMQFIEPVND